MKRDSDGRRKNGLGEGSLLSLRSKPAKRERERGLTLTLRDRKQKTKDNLNVKRPRNKKLS